jgi:hypothetical protein
MAVAPLITAVAGAVSVVVTAADVTAVAPLIIAGAGAVSAAVTAADVTAVAPPASLAAMTVGAETAAVFKTIGSLSAVSDAADHARER